MNKLPVNNDFCNSNLLLKTKLPVTIHIEIGGKYQQFKPAEDISPIEVALLLQLFLCLSATGMFGTYDVEAYITDHNLLRHFSVRDEPK